MQLYIAKINSSIEFSSACHIAQLLNIIKKINKLHLSTIRYTCGMSLSPYLYLGSLNARIILNKNNDRRYIAVTNLPGCFDSTRIVTHNGDKMITKRIIIITKYVICNKMHEQMTISNTMIFVIWDHQFNPNETNIIKKTENITKYDL